MVFVIPNDSRNKSAVMRSHWILFSFFFRENHPSQLRTVNLFLKPRLGSVFKAPMNQYEADQLLPQGDLPATEIVTAFLSMFDFF